jgi:hypothetical protein
LERPFGGGSIVPLAGREQTSLICERFFEPGRTVEDDAQVARGAVA